MTPADYTEWAKLGIGFVFGVVCLVFLNEYHKANTKKLIEMVAERDGIIKRLEDDKITQAKERDAIIARYDSTLGKVTDALLESAEAMTASRIDAAWERNQTERRKR